MQTTAKFGCQSCWRDSTACAAAARTTADSGDDPDVDEPEPCDDTDPGVEIGDASARAFSRAARNARAFSRFSSILLIVFGLKLTAPGCTGICPSQTHAHESLGEKKAAEAQQVHLLAAMHTDNAMCSPYLQQGLHLAWTQPQSSDLCLYDVCLHKNNMSSCLATPDSERASVTASATWLFVLYSING